jgi:hypothetical protein
MEFCSVLRLILKPKEILLYVYEASNISHSAILMFSNLSLQFFRIKSDMLEINDVIIIPHWQNRRFWCHPFYLVQKFITAHSFGEQSRDSDSFNSISIFLSS